MDPAALVAAVLGQPSFSRIGLECLDELLVEECTRAMWEAVGGPEPPRNPMGLKPLGGIFHIQQTPLVFLHCVTVQDPTEEAGHLAECALFQRATEMFFAEQPTYPVVFLVEGGSPDFWMYLDIFSLGRGCLGKQGIYKVASKYSMPLIIPYTSLAEAVQRMEEIVLDSLAALIVPPAER